LDNQAKAVNRINIVFADHSSDAILSKP